MSAAEWVTAARESVEASEYADYRHAVCTECGCTWPCRTADAIAAAGVR